MRIGIINATVIILVFLYSCAAFADEKWADAPANLTTEEFLDLAFRKFIIPENMRFVDIKFYPGTSPENAFVLVEQGWADGQLTTGYQKRINRLSNSYSKVFDEYVNNMPAIQKRWPDVGSKNHFVIRHTRFPDMNKTIAVTISGELKFDRDSIRKAADTLNRRAGRKLFNW
jgi:hypothetical protein